MSSSNSEQPKYWAIDDSIPAIHQHELAPGCLSLPRGFLELAEELRNPEHEQLAKAMSTYLANEAKSDIVDQLEFITGWMQIPIDMVVAPPELAREVARTLAWARIQQVLVKQGNLHTSPLILPNGYNMPKPEEIH